MNRPVSSDIVIAAQESQRAWRIPASVTIGQWALESGWGSRMPLDSHNPFGIKARPGEPSVNSTTTEIVHGQTVRVVAAFRRFDSYDQAFDRHGQLLAKAPIYAQAFGALPDVNAFIRLMGPHYATDPRYADKLLSVIDGAGLRRFDLPATDYGKAATLAAISGQETKA